MSSFPFDLIQEVLDRSIPGTLASCALVSRDVLELSRSRLYRSLKMDSDTIVSPPHDIATACSHLLRYVRYFQIDFDTTYNSISGPIRQDTLTVLKELGYYGNLTTIWFKAPTYFKGGGFLDHLSHFTPLLQLESVTYIRAPIIHPRVSEEPQFKEANDFLQALFLSKACVELTYHLNHYSYVPPFDYPTLLSKKPSVNTLCLEFYNLHDVQLYRQSWKWFASHVNLSLLRRLYIEIALPKDSDGIGSALSYSFPESLSDLSIYRFCPPDLQAPIVSDFPIENLHYLENISLTIYFGGSESQINPYIHTMAQFLERISTLSRNSLRTIKFRLTVDPHAIRDTATNNLEWNTLGEVLSSFPSAPRTFLCIPPQDSLVPGLTSTFLSGMPHAYVECDPSVEMFSRDSEEYRRGLQFGWEHELE